MKEIMFLKWYLHYFFEHIRDVFSCVFRNSRAHVKKELLYFINAPINKNKLEVT